MEEIIKIFITLFTYAMLLMSLGSIYFSDFNEFNLWLGNQPFSIIYFIAAGLGLIAWTFLSVSLFQLGEKLTSKLF